MPPEVILQAFVKEKGLDVGFAYDGDADRCIAVDENGNVIDGDLILFERFIEKRLQVIDYQSQEKQPINDKKIAGNKISEEAEGPFFVCLDTSGSMAGAFL